MHAWCDADLAEYAEREAGSQSPRASPQPDAGPSGEADGSAPEASADGHAVPVEAGELANGSSQPSTSQPSTEELVDQWMEQMRDNHRCTAVPH